MIAAAALAGCVSSVDRRCCRRLSGMQGVGPATASAILEAFDASIPFQSDQAMLAALGTKDYTVAYALKLTGALRKKAAQLSKGTGSRQWTAKEVEMCLWAEAVSSAAAAAAGGAGGAGGSGSKGKAAESGGKKRKAGT